MHAIYRLRQYLKLEIAKIYLRYQNISLLMQRIFWNFVSNGTHLPGLQQLNCWATHLFEIKQQQKLVNLVLPATHSNLQIEAMHWYKHWYCLCHYHHFCFILARRNLLIMHIQATLDFSSKRSVSPLRDVDYGIRHTVGFPSSSHTRYNDKLFYHCLTFALLTSEIFFSFFQWFSWLENEHVTAGLTMFKSITTIQTVKQKLLAVSPASSILHWHNQSWSEQSLTLPNKTEHQLFGSMAWFSSIEVTNTLRLSAEVSNPLRLPLEVNTVWISTEVFVAQTCSSETAMEEVWQRILVKILNQNQKQKNRHRWKNMAVKVKKCCCNWEVSFTSLCCMFVRSNLNMMYISCMFVSVHTSGENKDTDEPVIFKTRNM